jgi:plastocyanin
MNILNMKKNIGISISIYFVMQFCLGMTFSVISETFAHDGGPDHGGDLPLNLGGNRMQYVGASNIVDVVINKGNKFEPEKVTVDKSFRVAFENRDAIIHRLMFKTGEDDYHDGGEGEEPAGGHELIAIVEPGKYWLLEFQVSGEFQYTCTLHGETGVVSVRY